MCVCLEFGPVAIQVPYLLPAWIVLEAGRELFVSKVNVLKIIFLRFSEMKALSQPSEAKATLKVA